MITFIAIIICITQASVNSGKIFITISNLLLFFIVLDVRIVGGQIAKVGQFPFIALIEVSRTTGVVFCSGTLVSQHYILTSAQCVEKYI